MRDGAIHRQHPALPVFMEDGLARLGLDAAEAIHSPHIVNAVHQRISPGSLGAPCRSWSPASPAWRVSPRSSLPSLSAASARREAASRRLNPDADSGPLRQCYAEIGEHCPRLLHCVRAIGRGLIPHRRQAEHVPWIAGAQRANDHIMRLRCVLDCNQMIADPSLMSKGRGSPGRVFEQRLPKRRIAPGFGDDAGTDMRADPGLMRLDDAVESRRFDIALLDQKGLEGPNTQLNIRQCRLMVVIVWRHDTKCSRSFGCCPQVNELNRDVTASG